MKILYFALFLLAFALVFWGLNGLIRKLAYPKQERYLHCRIIPAVLVMLLAATNVYTVSYLLQAVDAVINAPVLADFFNMILPQRAYELLYMLLVLLGLNLAVTLLVIVTILLVKLVFIRKRQFVDIEDYVGVGRLLHLPWLLTSKFYEEKDGNVQLSGRGFTLGIWAGGLKNAFAILWALEMAVAACSILWGGEDWNAQLFAVTKAWYLLPMAGFLLVEQIQLWLEGASEQEAGTFGSAEIQEVQKGDMCHLVEAYRSTFGNSNALLYSDISGTSETEREGLASNDLGNRQILDCTQPDVLNVIANQLQQCGVRQSEQYQNALIELLNGRSINICDHCEGEFLIFLAAYLNFHMSQGKTALLLCRDAERAEQLCQAMKREMHRLNSLYSVWDVRTLREAEVNSRMSMLICSFDDFLDHHISGKRRDFVGDLFCTVVVDGFDLFSRNSIRVERLFGELRSLDGMEQYVVFTDVDNDALRTSIEQVIKQEIMPFNNDALRPNTGIMIWREESCCKLQRQIGVGNALSPYMGAALPLALVAAKYDFPQMYLMGDESRGDRSYSDVLTMSGKEVARFIAKNVNLKSVIRYQLDEALKQRELSMIIAYDADYNFFNALWQWIKYGGTHGSLIHIVSPPYLLREYFVANFQQKHLLLKNNEFDALISYHLGMKVSNMAVLLMSLCDEALTEEELMEKSKEFHWDYENVEQLLTDCLGIVLTREEIHSVYECFHFEEEKRFLEDRGQFETHTRITLTDATIRRRLQELIGYVNLVSKDDQHRSLPILRGNVYNYYQREQIIAVGGYLYQIKSINGGNVYAEQTLPRDVPEYYQICDFSFENYQQVDQCVDSGFMDFNICTAAVTRHIYGYWSSNMGNCFAGKGDLQLNDLCGMDGKPMDSRFDCANILEINIRRSVFGDRAVEAVRLCAYMFKELFKTLFPVTHQNLFTAVAEGIGDDLIPRVLAEGRDSSLDDIVCSLIPRVRQAPAAGGEFITMYVVELSCIEYGMVQMLYKKHRSVLLMMREYLSWYLGQEGQENPEGEAPRCQGSYLHFGSDSVPGVFAPEELLNLCRKATPEAEEIPEPTGEAVSEKGQICTFCGRPSLFPVELSDGRCMCGHCKDHQLTQKDEIKSMFVDTVRYLTEGYSISLPKNIHVRFQSASAIARATGGVEGGRILGFYNSGNHQLWLEARGPRVAMQSTLIHELTHAWQFSDRAFSQALQQVLNKYPRKERALVRLLLLEGHAVYMEIETMRKMHEEAFADRMQEINLRREDEYGVGYRLVRGYIQDQAGMGSHMTPYKAMTQLLQDIIDGKVTIK